MTGLLIAAVLPSSVAAEPASGIAVRELSESSVARADDYWTAKRMRNAQPVELEVAGESPQQRQDDPIPTVAPIPYSSFELTDTTSYPNRVHGKVFFSKPGQGNFVCSGTVVNSSNDSTVITAGHCVKESGVWATNFAFVPGYRNGSAPFGVWSASTLLATQQWVQSEDLRHDVGAAVIARNPTGQEIEDVVGGRGIAFNQPAEQVYLSHGYPAASPFDGSKLWACSSQFGWFDTGLPGTGPPTMAIGCNMTGGSSGGGWVIGGQNVVSLNSYKYLSQTDVMFGPYFGSTAQDLFNQAQGGTPGSSAAIRTPPAAGQPVPLATTPKCKKAKKKKRGKNAKKKRGKKAKKKAKKKKKKRKKVCRIRS
ncbi:MAG: trypsin-like serine peptidase [Solirubrobacterales bacterium]